MSFPIRQPESNNDVQKLDLTCDQTAPSQRATDADPARKAFVIMLLELAIVLSGTCVAIGEPITVGGVALPFSDVEQPIGPEDVSYLVERGDFWMKSDRYDLAFQHYVLAAEIAMNNQMLGQQRHAANRAISAVKRQRKAERDDHLHGLVGYVYQLRGRAKLNSEEPRGAIRDFEQQLENGWQTHVAMFDIGNSHNKLGEDHKAIFYYNDAIESQRDYGPAHRNLAHVYRKRGDMVLAIDSFQKATRYEPENANNHKWLGVCWATVGFPEQARLSFTNAVAMDASLSTEVGMHLDLLGGFESSGHTEHRFARTESVVLGLTQVRLGFFETVAEGDSFFESQGEGPNAIRFRMMVDGYPDLDWGLFEVLDRRDGWVKLRGARSEGWTPEDFVFYDVLAGLSATGHARIYDVAFVD